MIRNAHLDGALVDLTVTDGVIAAVEPAHGTSYAADDLDLGGRLFVPPLVNGHAHLDKTFWGLPWRPHRPGGSVRERVAHERAIRAEETAPQAPRTIALAQAMARAGVGAIRTHCDVDSLVGLSGLEAVLEARAAVAGEAVMQIVAFPQSGILADPGTADLMAAALAAGADVVGGLDPAGFDGDVAAHLDVVFGLATTYEVPVDIHLHDRGPEGLAEIDAICARTVALGLQGRVAVSHAYALGEPYGAEIGPTLDRLADARVAIMTDGPAGSPPPVKRMREAGVTVFSGSDGIRDAWTPYGAPSMMQIAHQVAYQNGFRADHDLEVVLDIVTSGGAAALGLPDPTIRVGAPADLVVIDANCPAEAVAGQVEPYAVLRAGAPLR